MKEMIELIKKNVDYSNKIINDLLDYSRDIVLQSTAKNPKAISERNLIGRKNSREHPFS